MKLRIDLVTSIDGSFLLKNGNIQGVSIPVSVDLVGEITEDESVIEDFSGAKKRIKSIIDDVDRTDMFSSAVDHKLMVFASKDTILELWGGVLRLREGIDTHVQVNDLNFRISTNENGVPIALIFKNDTLVLALPLCDIALIQKEHNEKEEAALFAYLSVICSKPGCVATVYRPEANTNVLPAMVTSHGKRDWSYIHGLSTSSSWGCRTPIHGHKSFFVLRCLDDVPRRREIESYVADSLHRLIHDSIWVYEEEFQSNIKERNEEGAVLPLVNRISYARLLPSPVRVHVNVDYLMQYNKTLCIVKDHPTIEVIADSLASVVAGYMREEGVKRMEMYISEGTSKGAVIEIDSERRDNKITLLQYLGNETYQEIR